MKNPCHHYEIENILGKTSKKWLVTGAAGFIGSHLCEVLLSFNQEVVAFDNFSTGSKKNIEFLSALNKSKFKFIEGDLLNIAILEESLKNVEVVLHQGALGSVPRSIEFPGDSFDSNVVGFHNLLLSCMKSGIKRIVYASSSSVYGDIELSPKKVGFEGEVLSPYALSKKVNEDYAKMYAKTYGLELFGLRYFNVFGPRQNPKGAYAAVIPRWISAALSGEDININGDGLNSRDFCYIDNVVYANLLSAAKNLDGLGSYSEVFNVACGESTDLNTLYELIKNKLKNLNINNNVSDPIYLPPREGDVFSSLGDISKSKEVLGYTPLVRFEEGLQKTILSFK